MDSRSRSADKEKSNASYSGRWVARLRGKVIAQGGTPEQALRAAQKSRHKEKPEISYMSLSLAFPSLLEKVRIGLPDGELYLVGGCLRDAFLGRLSHDLDFAVPQNAVAIARRLASALGADFYILDSNFDTARIIVSNPDATRDILDFAAFRGPNLESDLRGRDFTINAIAYDLRAQALLDPLNGAADLRAKIIRACTEASFTDDPVRILRAVRQAAALGFKIETSTRNTMKQAASLLPNVSPERQRDELFKLLDGRQPDAALRALELLGVFPYFLPELSALKGVQQSAPHVFDVWEHTLKVIQHLEGILAVLAPGYEAEDTNDLFTGLLTLRLGRFREQFAAHFANSLNADRSLRSLLFFAALYHDVAKPATRTTEETGRIRFFDHDKLGTKVAADRAGFFNLSNSEIDRLSIIIEHHMRFHALTSRMEAEKKEPSRKAIYRFFRDTQEAGIDLILLGLADLRGTRGSALAQETWTAALDVGRILLENYWEKPAETVSPPRLVDGNDVIIEYGLEPGPIIGKLLEAIREAQATGKISSREEALSFGRDWLKENNQ